MRKFYTNINLDCEKVVLEEDFNHIVNVLRKKEGDSLILFNNNGIDYTFIIEKINKRNLELKFISKKENYKNNFCNISVFQALIKNDKLELIVQKFSQLREYKISDHNQIHCLQQDYLLLYLRISRL